MPLTQVQVNAPSATSYGDGMTPPQLGGRQGEAIVSQLHGNYYTQASRGNLFYASNAGAGTAFTIYSNTSYVGFALLNPAGSGKNLSIVKVNLGLNSQASTAMATWGYVWQTGAGTGIGTPLSAITQITATRGAGIVGVAGQGNSVAIAASAMTLGTAFVWPGRNAAFNATNAAITVGTATNCTEDFDGTMIVPPNTVWAVSSHVLSGWTACATVFWEETPL